MKKIIKKSLKIYTILISIFFLSTNVMAETINNYGLNITDVEYNNLYNLGFEDEEIMNMPEEILNGNKNIISTLISKDTKYYKTTIITKNTIGNSASTLASPSITYIDEEITEQEYNNSVLSDLPSHITTLGSETVTTEYKKMVLSLSYISSTHKYRAKNVLTWRKMPATRSRDIIAISNNNAVSEPVANSENTYISYSVTDSCLATSTPKSITAKSNFTYQKQPSGIGATFKLPSDTTKKYTWNDLLNQPYPCKDTKYKNGASGSYSASIKVNSLIITHYHDLSKVASNNPTLNVYGSYKHAKKTVSATPNFNVSFSNPSISVSASLSDKYDSMTDTQTSVTNPAW